MKQPATSFRLFLSSQHFSDGLRTTLAVLVPALIASFFGALHIGMLFSLGALCVSLADTPGAIINRTNTMLFCMLFIFFTALVTSFAQLSLVSMGALVFTLSFFFSMFLVYGNRGAAVGNAALLVMVLTMDNEPLSGGPGAQAFFVFCGGLWYTGISLLANRVAPFRAAQRTLGESTRELAVFLRIKADFYDGDKNLQDAYRRLLSQQVVVSEKQDAVREVLYKTRQVVKDASPTGRKLLLAFTDTVDLFEEITAAYYDYASLRRQYGHTGVPDQIAVVARMMADELTDIGFAIQANTDYQKKLNLDEAIRQLKKSIDATDLPAEGNKLVLKKLLVNLRRMMQRLEDLRRYFDGSAAPAHIQKLPLHQFVGHQSLDPRLLLGNLNLKSAVFRFSLRVGIAALAGFMIAQFIAPGHHSYWILMTIIFMLKPSFSLTRQRNIERIIGTLTGGIIGIGLLVFIRNQSILFGLMVVLMLGTYSLMRTRYLLSVIFMTPFILILFSFLGVGFIDLLQERVIDTLIGCLVALAAGYLLFPNWEAQQLTTHLKAMLQANSNYLLRVNDLLWGRPVDPTEYKLVRKEVYVSSANLSAAFQRMLSEPKKTQKRSSELQHFVVLNHILFSNIATLSATLQAQPTRVYPGAVTRPVRKVLNSLCASLNRLDTSCTELTAELPKYEAVGHDEVLTADDVFLKEQLEFMHRLSEDIRKATEQIA